MQDKYSRFLDKFYRQSSIQEDIEELSAPSTKIDKKIILNLITKYIYHYLHNPNDHQLIIKPDLLALNLEFLSNNLTDNHKRSPKIGNQAQLEKIIDQNEYALRMLNDIQKTAALILEIINLKTPEFPKRQTLIGIDAGTGTGILLIAQYILALRNKLKNPLDLIGIEITRTTAERSNQILQKLQIGTVKRGNTTKQKTYKFIEKKPVFCYTNENIPNSTSIIFSEPLLQNYKAFFDAIKKQTTKPVIFPEKVKFNISIKKIINDPYGQFAYYENQEPLGGFERTVMLNQESVEKILAKMSPATINILDDCHYFLNPKLHLKNLKYLFYKSLEAIGIFNPDYQRKEGNNFFAYYLKYLELQNMFVRLSEIGEEFHEYFDGIAANHENMFTKRWTS